MPRLSGSFAEMLFEGCNKIYLKNQNGVSVFTGPLRHPVDKAKSSDAAILKKQARTTADGWQIHSFNTLLAEMGTLCQNTCRAGQVKTDIRFNQFTEPTTYQMHIFDLLGLKKP